MAERWSPEATRLLADWERAGIRPCGPQLLPYEVINAIFKRVAGAQLSVEDAKALIRGFSRVSPAVVSLGATTSERAVEIADQLKQTSAMDSHYLALAERLGCEFWTADRYFYDAARAAFPDVHWIGERQGVV